MATKQNTALEMQELFEGKIIGEEVISSATQRSVQGFIKPYHTRLNPPKQITQTFKQPSKVQESPYDARSPQEVLQQHGMYKDPSIYTQEPQKIYMDLTKYGDYQEMLNRTIDAKEHFNSLDVDIRAKFNHNPLEFANYLASPDFDVDNILTEKERKALRDYHDQLQQQEDYEKYIQSDEYKAALAEQEAYNAYRNQQFEEWKKNRK